MATSAGYLLSKSQIKSIAADTRANGLSLATLVGKEADWYVFVEDSTSEADDENVLMPDDNPASGRYHRYGGDRSTGFAHKMLCFEDATVAGSGKAIEFYSAHSNLELIVKIGFGMPDLAAIDKPVYIHRWSNEVIANAQFISGIGYKEEPAIIKLPASGGRGRINITSNFTRITAGVKKADGLPDTPFVLVSGNTITLLGI